MGGTFHRFSTGGNTTLFVEDWNLLPQAMQCVPAEQAGAADLANSILRMAADEFCVNACIAYAALLSLHGMPVKKLRIGDLDVMLTCRGQSPEWLASATFEMDIKWQRGASNANIAHMPGISHALLSCGAFPDYSDAKRRAMQERQTLGLEKKPACGVVWWRREKDDLRIMPLVSVPAAGTCGIEGACGSASVALAASLGDGEYRIWQQSGSCLTVTINGKRCRVEAPVRLLACGELWLP